jgi:hypothetical protein
MKNIQLNYKRCHFPFHLTVPFFKGRLILMYSRSVGIRPVAYIHEEVNVK